MSLSPLRLAVVAIAAGAAAISADAAVANQIIDGAASPRPEVIEKYSPRFGRARPVIAILAENSGTELTDFVIPFGILSSSDSADVVTVSTLPGVVKMRPALQLQTQTTTAGFDQRFAQGADYVIVPALMNVTDPAVLSWIKAQAAKGATIVSICNGAEVVAETGLMDGHRATAHWASETKRLTEYPKVRWEKNIRYVADGQIVSSAGISASIPISIALVEAIAGQERADKVAQRFGVAEWGSKHNSDAFQLQPGEKAPSMRDNSAATETIGIPLVPGMDEVALALTAEAYSHTGKAHAIAVSSTDDPVATRNGLLIVPEATTDGSRRPTNVLPSISDGLSAQVLDKALANVEATYGHPAAYAAARIMEYPGFKK